MRVRSVRHGDSARKEQRNAYRDASSSEMTTLRDYVRSHERTFASLDVRNVRLVGIDQLDLGGDGSLGVDGSDRESQIGQDQVGQAA